MTLRWHGDRYFHKILCEIGYCGLDPRINPLCVPRRARLAARPRGRQQVRVSLLEARVREPGAIIQVTLTY